MCRDQLLGSGCCPNMRHVSPLQKASRRQSGLIHLSHLPHGCRGQSRYISTAATPVVHPPQTACLCPAASVTAKSEASANVKSYNLWFIHDFNLSFRSPGGLTLRLPKV